MKTYTKMMMEATAPYNNPYQGKDKKVLFVCSAGLLRSATAARLYAKKYNTRAAGSQAYALIPVTTNLVLWADEVVFVNQQNFNDLQHLFDWTYTKVIVLNIPDKYEHMHPELIKTFEDQYECIDF